MSSVPGAYWLNVFKTPSKEEYNNMSDKKKQIYKLHECNILCYNNCQFKGKLQIIKMLTCPCQDLNCIWDCGTLNCGCIDVCRNRCGTHEYDDA
jgi:hypothetical protein